MTRPVALTIAQRAALQDLYRYGECEPSRMGDGDGADGGASWSPVLRALAKRGLVECVQTYEARGGIRPRPSVYRITDAGVEALDAGFRDAVSRVVRGAP